MLNWVLAAIAAALWSTAYGWYFYPDLKRWLWWRQHRKWVAEQQRIEAYAAWMRRPRARATPRAGGSGGAAPQPAPPRPPATVIRFPTPHERRTPRG